MKNTKPPYCNPQTSTKHKPQRINPPHTSIKPNVSTPTYLYRRAHSPPAAHPSQPARFPGSSSQQTSTCYGARRTCARETVLNSRTFKRETVLNRRTFKQASLQLFQRQPHLALKAHQRVFSTPTVVLVDTHAERDRGDDHCAK